MHAVTFGTLDDEAKPIGRAHVPVVEKLGQAGEQDSLGSRRGSKADDQIQNRARQRAVGDELKRMLVETRDYFDALGAMVHLVKPAPERRRAMAPVVPPIINERDHEIADDGAARDSQTVGRPQTVTRHPVIPQKSGNVDDGYLAAVQESRASPPAGDFGPAAAGLGEFDQQHENADCEHQTGNGDVQDANRKEDGGLGSRHGLLLANPRQPANERPCCNAAKIV
jgi:hypothetical protein